MQMKCQSSTIWRYLHNENSNRYQMLPKHIGFHCHTSMHIAHWPSLKSSNTKKVYALSLDQTTLPRIPHQQQWSNEEQSPSYFLLLIHQFSDYQQRQAIISLLANPSLECFESHCCTVMHLLSKTERRWICIITCQHNHLHQAVVCLWSSRIGFICLFLDSLM